MKSAPGPPRDLLPSPLVSPKLLVCPGEDLQRALQLDLPREGGGEALDPRAPPRRGAAEAVEPRAAEDGAVQVPLPQPHGVGLGDPLRVSEAPQARADVGHLVLRHGRVPSDGQEVARDLAVRCPGGHEVVYRQPVAAGVAGPVRLVMALAEPYPPARHH